MVHGGTPACREHFHLGRCWLWQSQQNLNLPRAPKGIFHFIYHQNCLSYDHILSYLLKMLSSSISAHRTIELIKTTLFDIFFICLWACSFFIISVWRGFHTRNTRRKAFAVFPCLRRVLFSICVLESLYLCYCKDLDSSQPLLSYLSLLSHCPVLIKTGRHTLKSSSCSVLLS